MSGLKKLYYPKIYFKHCNFSASFVMIYWDGISEFSINQFIYTIYFWVYIYVLYTHMWVLHSIEWKVTAGSHEKNISVSDLRSNYQQRIASYKSWNCLQYHTDKWYRETKRLALQSHKFLWRVYQDVTISIMIVR